jgi:hypothetical protein
VIVNNLFSLKQMPTVAGGSFRGSGDGHNCFSIHICWPAEKHFWALTAQRQTLSVGNDDFSPMRNARRKKIPRPRSTNQLGFYF